MFRDLSAEESAKVKKWRAPNLGDGKGTTNPLAGMTAQPLGDGSPADIDIADLENIVREAQDNLEASNDDFAKKDDQPGISGHTHASLDISNPSAGMMQQSYDEGFAAGLTQGQSQGGGLDAAHLQKLIMVLSAKHNQFDADIENELVLLSKAIAKMLLRREVETDDDAIFAIVQNALEQIPMTSNAPTVVLNPIDYAVIESLPEAIDLAIYKYDAALARGDCRIESGSSILEAGIDALVGAISSTRMPPIVHLQDNDNS